MIVDCGVWQYMMEANGEGARWLNYELLWIRCGGFCIIKIRSYIEILNFCIFVYYSHGTFLRTASCTEYDRQKQSMRKSSKRKKSLVNAVLGGLNGSNFLSFLVQEYKCCSLFKSLNFIFQLCLRRHSSMLCVDLQFSGRGSLATQRGLCKYKK